jgi:hypothetical protein
MAGYCGQPENRFRLPPVNHLADMLMANQQEIASILSFVIFLVSSKLNVVSRSSAIRIQNKSKRNAAANARHLKAQQAHSQ